MYFGISVPFIDCWWLAQSKGKKGIDTKEISPLSSAPEAPSVLGTGEQINQMKFSENLLCVIWQIIQSEI